MDFWFLIFIQLFALIVVYFLFPRQITNLIFAIIPRFRREFVVVHFIKLASRKPLLYYIIPDKKTGFGKIENGQYDLRKENSLPDYPLFKRRLHFIIDEGNSIPRKIKIKEIKEHEVAFIYKNKIFFEGAIPLTEEKIDNKAIMTWAFRVNAAFKSIAYDFIYGEKRQWAFIIALAAAAIALGVAIYAVLAINNITPLVETIYTRTILGNETLVIRGV